MKDIYNVYLNSRNVFDVSVSNTKHLNSYIKGLNSTNVFTNGLKNISVFAKGNLVECDLFANGEGQQSTTRLRLLEEMDGYTLGHFDSGTLNDWDYITI